MAFIRLKSFNSSDNCSIRRDFISFFPERNTVFEIKPCLPPRAWRRSKGNHALARIMLIHHGDLLHPYAFTFRRVTDRGSGSTRMKHRRSNEKKGGCAVNKETSLRYFVAVIGCTVMILFGIEGGYATDNKGRVYVGSAACKDCHENEFKNFAAYTKKASSFKSCLLYTSPSPRD